MITRMWKIIIKDMTEDENNLTNKSELRFPILRFFKDLLRSKRD